MKIAVVLAHNWSNAGMYSVDLAAFRFFESMGHVTDYFVASGAKPHSLFKSGQVPVYRISDGAPLMQYDRVVYWGDFTTNPSYALDDFATQINSYDGPLGKNEIFKLWGDIFLMRGRKAPPMFSFGQNFQNLGAAASTVDLTSLAPLYERFELLMPRDSISFEQLRTHVPGKTSDSLLLGTDAAFVLPDMVGDVGRRDPRKIGLLFARSKLDNPAELVAELKRRGYEIALLNLWLTLPRNTYHDNFYRMCRTVQDCGVVLTDTYHLAVNAIRLGTTPVVMGNDDRGQTSTISDFKKRVMLRDLGAEELYAEMASPRLSAADIARIADQIDATAQRQTPHPLHEQARRNKDAAIATLKERLLD